MVNNRNAVVVSAGIGKWLDNQADGNLKATEKEQEYNLRCATLEVFARSSVHGMLYKVERAIRGLQFPG